MDDYFKQLLLIVLMPFIIIGLIILWIVTSIATAIRAHELSKIDEKTKTMMVDYFHNDTSDLGMVQLRKDHAKDPAFLTGSADTQIEQVKSACAFSMEEANIPNANFHAYMEWRKFRFAFRQIVQSKTNTYTRGMDLHGLLMPYYGSTDAKTLKNKPYGRDFQVDMDEAHIHFSTPFIPPDLDGWGKSANDRWLYEYADTETKKCIQYVPEE
jgi:hypothetical protein